MSVYFPSASMYIRELILDWVGSEHFYEVFPLYKDLGKTTFNAGD